MPQPEQHPIAPLTHRDTAVFEQSPRTRRLAQKEGRETDGPKTCAAYIERQDALLVERHVFFDHNSVTDHRLTDGHVTGNVNVIPDIGMIQVNIVS